MEISTEEYEKLVADVDTASQEAQNLAKQLAAAEDQRKQLDRRCAADVLMASDGIGKMAATQFAATLQITDPAVYGARVAEVYLAARKGVADSLSKEPVFSEPTE